MEKRLILLADDDKAIRDLYFTALTAAGLDVVTALNGEEAVTIALSKHPALILMDILMPNMNGQEAVARIRNDAWGKKARIIYLTNLSDPENVAEAFAQRPEEYIIKAQTDVKEVVNKVRMALY